VTIYDALKKSLNTISVAVFNEMEKKPVADMIRKAAFLYTDKEMARVPEVLSLALGTCEFSSLELATAYSLFPRGGKNIYPVIIKRIYDRKGNVYYDYTRKNNTILNKLYPAEHREAEQLISQEASFEIVQMMRGVFEKGGTGVWPAYITGFNIPGYGKSGTSQDYRDGWFAGFTDNEVSAVWVGFDNNKSTLLPGASTAGVIWCDYNKRMSPEVTRPIDRPKNMRLYEVDLDTGLLAVDKCVNTKEFYFWTEGPVPEKCYIHQGLDSPDLEEF
jgi:membrane carboxypeptidase/penicillin-binding protein